MLNDPFHIADFVFHRGSVDRIDEILSNGRLITSEGKKGISFTEGIPVLPGHSDCAIVFKREFIDTYENAMIKIDYSDRQMLEQLKIIDDPSSIRSSSIAELEFQKLQCEKIGDLDRLIKLNYVIEMYSVLSDEQLLNMQIEQISEWENEVLIETDEMGFEMCDIVAVIPFHRFHLEYFESLNDYKDKTIFIDDLFRYGEHAIKMAKEIPRTALFSDVFQRMLLGKGIRKVKECDIRIDKSLRLLEKLASKGAQISKLMEMNTIAFHIACSLIDDPEDYRSLQQILPECKFPTPPSILTEQLSNLHLLPNDQFKSDFLDHISSRLSMSEPLLSIMDDLYISEIAKRSKI